MDREELYLILLMLFTEILETKLFRNIGFLKRKIFFQSVLLYSAQSAQPSYFSNFLQYLACRTSPLLSPVWAVISHL